MVVPNVQVPFRRAVGRRRGREVPGQIGILLQHLTAQFPEFLILRYQNYVHRHDMHRSCVMAREQDIAQSPPWQFHSRRICSTALNRLDDGRLRTLRTGHHRDKHSEMIQVYWTVSGQSR